MLRQALLALALLLTTLPVAVAHEHVQVGDGRYELTVGWVNEPSYVGLPNGLDLKVARLGEAADGHGDDHGDDHAHAEAGVVENAHLNLTVTYEYGGKTFQPLDFRPAFGRPGWYTADITPTRPGIYTVHIAGTIEGVPVDVRVEPAEIEDLEASSFPEADPAYHELAAKVEDLEARLARLEADTAAQIRDPPAADDIEGRDTPAVGLAGVVALAFIVALTLRRRA